jgi:hypothetical protein
MRSRLRQVVDVSAVLLRKPTDVKYLPKLAKGIGKSTLETRLPWLPFELIDYLDRRLNSESRVFEFGGGGSTAWFSDRVAVVVTVEHDPQWYEALRTRLGSAKNLDLRLVEVSSGFSGYVRNIEQETQDFDLVLVDGRARVACAQSAAIKVRHGGFLVLDDSDRPKYADVHRFLAEWPHQDFFGLVPGKDRGGQSTLWIRP